MEQCVRMCVAIPSTGRQSTAFGKRRAHQPPGSQGMKANTTGVLLCRFRGRQTKKDPELMHNDHTYALRTVSYGVHANLPRRVYITAAAVYIRGL